ncbi:MAG TPA: hypothetical protein VN673_14905, partial [Clostridia bacterium]|nr:hypothetical protein [Clostridia bacterium]
ATRLRGIGCPEETVKDILTAEASRRFRQEEEELRPRPADHVPITWSSNPSERKLFQRREQAAALARKKAALLREALGYEVEVAMPAYALTSSGQRLKEFQSNLPPEQQDVVKRAREEYWTKVEALQDRTKGFWQSEDVAELEQLKIRYRALIGRVGGAP